jgi:predicted DNA binding protein
MIAEVHLSHPRMALTETIRSVPEATVETAWYPLVTDGDRVGFYGAVVPDASGFGPFEAAMEADRTVVDASVAATLGRRQVYRTELSSETMLLAPELVGRGGGFIGAWSAGEGWLARFQAPDRRTFVGFRRSCTDRGVEFETKRLYSSERLSTVDGTGLTDRQRRVLLTAYEAGYFEEPRAVTLEELGDRLGISSTAAGGRLRRAISRLVEAQFPVDGNDGSDRK